LSVIHQLCRMNLSLSIDVNWRQLAFSYLYLSKVSQGIVRVLADSAPEDALAFLNKPQP
jgi:hypothetical protein